MFESNWDKHTITFKATFGTLEVFCFSPSPSSPISSFVLFLLLSILRALLRFPLISMPSFEIIPWLPSPLALPFFFLCLPFVPQWRQSLLLMEEKKEKKNLRLVSNLNNWTAQFSSSWTLLGENGRGGWLCTQTRGPGWACLRPLSVCFFTGWDQC